MSSIACTHCGHIMKDGIETYSNNYFGSIVKNGEFHEALSEAANVLAKIAEAHKENNLKVKVKELCPVYTDQPIKDIFDDILSSLIYLKVGLCYAVCTKCGTLMVQNGNDSQFYSAYTPDEDKISKYLSS